MDSTHQYYQQFADEFFASTVGVDMAVIRARFISKLKPHAHILDVGCGSGRDAKAFSLAGFSVTAIDSSENLARLASAHCGFEVAVRRFEDVDEVDAFDCRSPYRSRCWHGLQGLCRAQQSPQHRVRHYLRKPRWQVHPAHRLPRQTHAPPGPQSGPRHPHRSPPCERCC